MNPQIERTVIGLLEAQAQEPCEKVFMPCRDMFKDQVRHYCTSCQAKYALMELNERSVDARSELKKEVTNRLNVILELCSFALCGRCHDNMSVVCDMERYIKEAKQLLMELKDKEQTR